MNFNAFSVFITGNIFKFDISMDHENFIWQVDGMIDVSFYDKFLGKR